MALEQALSYYYTDDYGLSVNTEAFRAQGIESTVEGGIGRNIFLRGGYTYLDAVVQRSFSSDNEAYFGGYAPTFDGIPIGAYSPLWGARPFRRPPHTGFISASYTQHALALQSYVFLRQPQRRLYVSRIRGPERRQQPAAS